MGIKCQVQRVGWKDEMFRDQTAADTSDSNLAKEKSHKAEWILQGIQRCWCGERSEADAGNPLPVTGFVGVETDMWSLPQVGKWSKGAGRRTSWKPCWRLRRIMFYLHHCHSHLGCHLSLCWSLTGGDIKQLQNPNKRLQKLQVAILEMTHCATSHLLG